MFSVQEDRKEHRKKRAASLPTPTGSLSSVFVYTAPLFFTLLVGATLLFLANIIFDQDALGRLLNPLQWSLGMIAYALLIVLIVFIIALFLITPALTAFLVNLKRPVLTSWSKAISSGIVLFLFCIFVMSIATYDHSRAHNTELTQYKMLLIYGLLFGAPLSLSVLLFGRLGSSWGIKRCENRLPEC
jgi:hypothetical protein